jgi:hypothetical protein
MTSVTASDEAPGTAASTVRGGIAASVTDALLG